jgi:hypothetical protein
MKKIGEYVYEMDQLLGVKTAFVPAPQQQQQGGGTDAAGGQSSQQGAGQGPDNSQLFQQVQQMVQQLPPDMQQSAMQQVEQISQMPPDQQSQGLQQIAQGLQQMQSQQGGSGQQGSLTPQGQQGQPTAQDQPGAVNTQGHVNAENQLDKTMITLSARELMDLQTGGKATKSLLAIKQMSHGHNQKMNQLKEQTEMKQREAQMKAQAASQGPMGGGGIYGAAPDMSGKMGPTQ